MTNVLPYIIFNVDLYDRKIDTIFLNNTPHITYATTLYCIEKIVIYNMYYCTINQLSHILHKRVLYDTLNYPISHNPAIYDIK